MLKIAFTTPQQKSWPTMGKQYLIYKCITMPPNVAYFNNNLEVYKLQNDFGLHMIKCWRYCWLNITKLCVYRTLPMT